MASKRTFALRSKVVIGFVLVFSALLIAAYISYESFTELKQASQTISRPDLKIKRIDSILIAVTKTENTLQEYSVLSSSDEPEESSRKLEAYYEQVAEVERIIESLESETQNEEYTLDSVLSLLRDKLVSLDAFLEIEEERDDFDFYDQALSELEIEVSTIASQRNEPHILEDTARQNVMVRVDKRGILGRLFSRDKDEPTFSDNQESEPITLAPDSVRQLLRQVRNDQARKQQQIDQRELTYLKNNAQVMGNIYELVGQLKAQEQARSQKRVAKARTAMDEAIIRIAIILIVAFLCTILIVYLIFADITRSDFYRNKLLKAKSRAERLARVKEDFLANMSHELRTPLNTILGFTQLMIREGDLTAQSLANLNIVNRSGEHLLELINDVLEMSKIEAGRVSLHPARFNLHYLLNNLEDMLQLRAQAKGLTLRFNCDAEVPAYIEADESKLRQVLLNLLGNRSEERRVGKECRSRWSPYH